MLFFKIPSASTSLLTTSAIHKLGRLGPLVSSLKDFKASG